MKMAAMSRKGAGRVGPSDVLRPIADHFEGRVPLTHGRFRPRPLRSMVMEASVRLNDRFFPADVKPGLPVKITVVHDPGAAHTVQLEGPGGQALGLFPGNNFTISPGGVISLKRSAKKDPGAPEIRFDNVNPTRLSYYNAPDGSGAVLKELKRLHGGQNI